MSEPVTIAGLSDELSWFVRTGVVPSPATETARTEYLKHVPKRELLAELFRRGLNSIRMEDVPDPQLWSEVGRRRQLKCQVHRGGPGRPPDPRCVCGRFTLNAARKRKHNCPPEAWRAKLRRDALEELGPDSRHPPSASIVSPDTSVSTS